MTLSPDHFILICSTCTEGATVEEMKNTFSDRLPQGFAIRTVDCMAGCDAPRTVGFQAAGKAQYLFGGIQTQHDVDALAEFAHQYQCSADGWTSATTRPRALYTKTLSRMPRIEAEGAQ